MAAVLTEPLLPGELLSQILRWSLHAHEKDAARITEKPFGDGKNPATRALIEQILFTRRFAPTYLAVLGLVVLCFAAAHWSAKLKRWRARQNYSKEQMLQAQHSLTSSSSSSSSSSTLHETPSPKTPASPKLEANETTRLLERAATPSQSRTSLLPRLRRHISSTLSRQPRPIGALASPANVLPSNGTSLLLLCLLGLNLFYLLFHTPVSTRMLFVLADRAGLLFVVNLPVLYVLAAKTNQPLKLLTGWSYEGLNIFHRRLGEWMIVLGVVHSGGMFGVWYTLLRPLQFGLVRFLSTKLVLLGIFALASYVAIWVTSTGWFRKLWYETFLGLHVLLQVAALVLLFFHHPGARPYVLASLGIWALDRIVGRMQLSSRKFVATLQVAEDGATVLLFCDIDVRRGVVGSNLHISNGWMAGQHVFVTVPSIGWEHSLQTHPFTIASPAPPSRHEGTWPLQLTIRAQNGFSRELLEYAKLHQHTEVFLDGPYGSLDALKGLQNASRKCLIAGGSGIAVTYPLAWSLLVQDIPDALVSTRTTYQNGQRHTPSLRNDFAPRERFDGELVHFWINQHFSHRNWITMYPRKEALKTSPIYARPMTGIEAVGATIWPDYAVDVADLEPTSYHTQDFPCEAGKSSGRPDVALELRQWVEDGRFKECRDSICVVVSGPDGLVRDVRNATARLFLEGWNIELFVEKFGW